MPTPGWVGDGFSLASIPASLPGLSAVRIVRLEHLRELSLFWHRLAACECKRVKLVWVSSVRCIVSWALSLRTACAMFFKIYQKINKRGPYPQRDETLVAKLAINSTQMCDVVHVLNSVWGG